MKGERLLDVYSLLDVVLKRSKNVELNYYLYSNKEKIQKEKTILDNVSKPTSEMNEFEKKRLNLCVKYCLKNEDNYPIIENKTFKGLNNNELFNVEYKKLYDEYSVHIEEYEKQLKEYKELLKKDIKLEFKKIPMTLIPNDLIDGNEQELLKDLIKHPES